MDKIKPLIADLPYPDTSVLTPDIYSGRLISFAYATQYGELSAVLQYTYHAVNFSLFSEETASLLQSISIAEMLHFKLLAKAMLHLGVNPVFTANPPQKSNFFNTSDIYYSTTREKMLLDDITGELNAIANYKKMISLLKNEQVAAIIERIVLDEELHVAALQQAIKRDGNCT